MFILNEPYVSDFMVRTISQKGYKVLDNEVSRRYLKNLISDFDASKEKKFYSNSENSIDWIMENLPNSDFASMIKISKDKVLFRKMLSKIYPDYFFRQIDFNEIKNLDFDSLPYPLILKPGVGFLSFGVYPVKNADEFRKISSKLDSDIKKFKDVFPQSVVDCSSFILEEMIEGEEYALDAYFDESGRAVILNIFHHPFFDETDVSDRVYYTSKALIQEFLEPAKDLLNKIGKLGNYKNFPFHLEFRANKNGMIPIELNPGRFCGWCITDIAQNAWGINVYQYFEENKKPNWDEILKNAPCDYFYFTIGDIPGDIDKKNIKRIDYEKYLQNISNPLEIRKIDYKTKPVFVIVFASCKDYSEIRNILKLKMSDFIVV